MGTGSEGDEDAESKEVQRDQTIVELIPNGEATATPTDQNPTPTPLPAQHPFSLSKAQFQDGQTARSQSEFNLQPLVNWLNDGEPLTVPWTPPEKPGLYTLQSADVRVIAAALRAGAKPNDFVFECHMPGDDGGHVPNYRSPRQLVNNYINRMDNAADSAAPSRFVIYPGNIMSLGYEFWNDSVEQVPEINRLCQENNCMVFLVAAGSHVAKRLPTSDLTICNIDPRPLIDALVRGCEEAARRTEQINELFDGRQINFDGLIKALDACDADQLDSEIEAAKGLNLDLTKASSFIKTHIIESTQPAEIAAAFTAACFDELSSNEFRCIAQALAETPGLVDPPQIKPGDPAPPLRTRVREATLATVGAKPWVRPSTNGIRMSLIALSGAQRYHERLRRELPIQASITSSCMAKQMSCQLIHGVVAPERWGPCCEVIGQILADEGGGAADSLGARLAAFWHSTDVEPILVFERVRNITSYGDIMLRRLCERTAELAGIDDMRVMGETAISLVRHAHATTPHIAWRTPTAAAFVSQMLATLPIARSEPLLQACLDGPHELLTLVSTSLTGGFGFTARGEADNSFLDDTLGTFVELAQEQDVREASLCRYAQGMTWRLAAVRLVADSVRLSDGNPSAISETLATQLLRYAGTMAQAEPALFDELPFDAGWLDRNQQTYLSLMEGWRIPPDYYVSPDINRESVLAAELNFIPTMSVLDASTDYRRLLSGALRRQVLEAFAVRLGVTGIPIETVALWQPEQIMLIDDPDDVSPKGGGFVFDADFAGVRNFRDLMARLRRGIPLLAIAFSQADIVKSKGSEQINVSIPEAMVEVARDRDCWPALRGAAESLRDALELLNECWRDAIDTLPRNEQLKSAVRQAALRRRIFSAWWVALNKAR